MFFFDYIGILYNGLLSKQKFESAAELKNILTLMRDLICAVNVSAYSNQDGDDAR